MSILDKLEAIEGDYLTAKQVAEILGVHPVTVRLWCRKRKIERRRIGRVWEIPKRAVLRRGRTEMPPPLLSMPYLSIPKAAHLLGISQHTLRRWCKIGKVPCRKMGRNYQLSRRTINELMGELQEQYLGPGYEDPPDATDELTPFMQRLLKDED